MEKFLKRFPEIDMLTDMILKGLNDSGMTPNEVIGIVIAIIILAYTIPSAFHEFFEANTTGWDSKTIAMWGLIPFLIVVVIIYKVYKN